MSSKVTELQTATEVSNSPTRGTLFVVSSPSGGGKGTLVRGVLELVDNLSYSVSYTTRGPRANELNGREYFFVDVPTFEEKIAEKTAAGIDMILEVDVQGAASVRQLLMDSVSVFILPPSFEVLKQRLCARGTDTPDNLELRLRNAPEELKQYSTFDYVIINDEIERAVGQLASIIHAERARCVRQEGLVRRVIEEFRSVDDLPNN